MKKLIGLYLLAFIGLIIIWAPNIYRSWLNSAFPLDSKVATGDIASLVPADQRLKVGAFYRDLADVAMVAGNIQSTDDLYTRYRAAVPLMQAAGKLPAGLGPFDKAVNDRINNSIGLKSEPLSDNKRKAFADVCDQVALELGVRVDNDQE